MQAAGRVGRTEALEDADGGRVVVHTAGGAESLLDDCDGIRQGAGKDGEDRGGDAPLPDGTKS